MPQNPKTPLIGIEHKKRFHKIKSLLNNTFEWKEQKRDKK